MQSLIELYPTFNECCEFHLWWQDDCSAYDANGNGGIPVHSNMYWADYDSGSCLRDCEPGQGFGCESVPPPIAVYESVEACCSQGQSWVDPKYCISRSNGVYSNGWVVNYGDEKCGESALSCSPYFAFSSWHPSLSVCSYLNSQGLRSFKRMALLQP